MTTEDAQHSDKECEEKEMMPTCDVDDHAKQYSENHEACHGSTDCSSKRLLTIGGGLSHKRLLTIGGGLRHKRLLTIGGGLRHIFRCRSADQCCAIRTVIRCRSTGDDSGTSTCDYKEAEQ